MKKYGKEIFIWEPYIFIGLKILILILLVIFGLELPIILSSNWTDTNNTARFIVQFNTTIYNNAKFQMWTK
jgi:hypothetical protein